jgi:ABC-type sugar transport system permease subunit
MYIRSRQRLVVPFLLPALVVYILFGFLPLLLTVVYSFTNWQGAGLDRPFYGLRNYILIFMDPQFRNALRNTGLFALAGGVLMFLPSLFISWALTQKIALRSLYRYVIIAPLMLSVVVVSLLWKLLYNPIFGPINNLLKLIGLSSWALPWLGDTRTALLAIIVATVWQQQGMWILLLSAGIERIPEEIMEAARVDGAGEWRTFRSVTFPLLWGVFRLLIILWIIQALQVFAQVYVMVPFGGVGGSADVVTTLLYQRAFSSSQFGIACAMATFLLFLIMALSILTNRFTRRDRIEF